MRRLVMSIAAATLLAAAAGASEVDDQARLIFAGGATLKKAEANCGASGRLTKRDQLAITFARAAAEQALPLSEVQKLSLAAEADAATASGTPQFCAETKTRKPALMNQIRKAGKVLAAKRV